MVKLIRDGQVAVLISTGYGAGWYTWNKEYPDIAFDKDIVEKVLDSDFKGAHKIASERYPGAYLGGVEDLEVEWVGQGQRFVINEYDGSEDLEILDEDYGLVA